MRHDHATERTNDKWRNGLKELKIADESTIPYEKKEGVGKAERSWGMMLPKARAMLIRCNGAGNLFLHAMVYARQVINELNQRGAKQSRSHIFYGKVSDVSKYKVFGCRGWARLDATTRGHKGDPVSVKCVLIGIAK